MFVAKSLVLIEESFREVARKMDFQILEFNGEADHIHVLIEYPPIAVLKKVRYGGESYAYARCPRRPMPDARCPMPYEHLMLLRKAISFPCPALSTR